MSRGALPPPAAPAQTPRDAAATAPDAVRVAGHFGEWLQGRLGPEGPLALVTVACPALGVTACARPSARLTLAQPDPAVLPRAALARLLSLRGRPDGGRFTLATEMPAGCGAGVSTASLVALARAAGDRAAPARLAAACLAIEGATDPLMFAAPDALLWAPRAARVLRDLPPPPEAVIVGGFRGPPRPTDPADHDFPDIAELVPAWERAARAGDLPALARLSTQSAARTARHRPRADGSDPLPDLAERLGALGRVAAHTGSAAGLIFAPGTVPQGAEAALRAAGFTSVLTFRTGGDAS